ncbi:MAG: glycosyltransferase [Algoriphagus sp.]|uniref:glycosyltransferase n=1 Tax=Algoriphagus sp. TaxID=1872435 RepID=UPI00261B4246|nr:glycosyltransferase [Algoriphagus sp.]MDG1277518.1 glycosyltransferase [Algoriphagus sp.]
MKHFLITRFNLGFEKNLKINGIDSYEWHQTRIEIFFNYTYPLIVGQDCFDFEWIVIFDPRTNKEVLDLFSEKDLFRKITILQCAAEKFLFELRNYIMVRTFSENFVITTRVDSDDGFFPDSLSRIQKICEKNQDHIPFAINLNKGLIVDVERGVLYKKEFPSNPFISLVENTKNIETVYFEEHLNVGKKFDVIEDSNRPYWLQLIHSGNLVNQVKGYPTVFYSKRIKKVSIFFIRSSITYRVFSLFKVISFKVLVRFK